MAVVDVDEPIKRLEAGHAAPPGKAALRDWAPEIGLLKARIRDLRAAASAKSATTGANNREDDNRPAVQSAAGKSLLESLAYAQTVQVKQERPKRTLRKGWRAEAFETTLSGDLMPDSGWKEKPTRGNAWTSDTLDRSEESL